MQELDRTDTVFQHLKSFFLSINLHPELC